MEKNYKLLADLKTVEKFLVKETPRSGVYYSWERVVKEFKNSEERNEELELAISNAKSMFDIVVGVDL